MAHFALLWKARTIEKYRQNYENEKYLSIQETSNPIPKKSLSQRLRCYRQDTQKRFSKIFQRIYPEGSSLSHFFLYLKTDQTCLNFVLKNLLGFLIGLALTYLCYLFLVFQLSISLFHATIVSSIIGILLTMGLAFSYRIRCLIFLLLPQFFSRAGRYTLTCYALVLILTGPATNTLKNSEVLTESMACRQEQIKTLVKEVSQAATKPLNSMRDSIKVMVQKIRLFARQLSRSLLKVNRLTLSVLETIQSTFSWMRWLSEICNTKMGSPYERCMKVLKGVRDYKRRYKANIAHMHKRITDKSEEICSDIKKYKAICVFTDFVTGSFVASIKRRLKDFSQRIRDMLNLRVHVQHSYSFFSNTSDSASQVAAGIVTEIRKRADPLLTWLSWSSCVTSLFLLLIIFRAKYYQHMFETRSCFDNKYITKELRDLDLNRLRHGRETILPLNRRERSKYVSTTSFRLVASEKIHLNRSIVFMTITTFKLLIHMVADYSLYWVLMTIQLNGKNQTPMPFGVPIAGMHMTGAGGVADMFRSLLMALTSPTEIPDPLPSTCLPNPNPPDFQRYTQIGILIFLLWFLSLFEPYGLRLRHVVMGLYRPERAKARAEWLFNHILKIRGGFMKFARRKLHRSYKYCSEEKYTFKRWLNTYIPSWLRVILRISKEEVRCLLCGTKELNDDPNTRLHKCDNEDCPGVYCGNCFSDICEYCTICSSPIDYDDLSDVSFEKGSSDESEDDSDEERATPEQDEEVDQDSSDYGSNDILLPKPLRDKRECQNMNERNVTEIKPNNITDIKNQIFNMTKDICTNNIIKTLTDRNSSKYHDLIISETRNIRLNQINSLDNNEAINYRVFVANNILYKIRQHMVLTEYNMGETKTTSRKDTPNDKKKEYNQKQVSKEGEHGNIEEKNKADEKNESNSSTSKDNNKNDKRNKEKQDDIVKNESANWSRFNRFNTLIYACWPNMKISLFNGYKTSSQTIVNNGLRDDKNFKTRKKDVKFYRRNENENARQYRIFTYLTEQDWLVKKSITYNSTEIESSLRAGEQCENPDKETIECLKNDIFAQTSINMLNTKNKPVLTTPDKERHVFICKDCKYYCSCPGHPRKQCINYAIATAGKSQTIPQSNNKQFTKESQSKDIKDGKDAKHKNRGLMSKIKHCFRSTSDKKNNKDKIDTQNEATSTPATENKHCATQFEPIDVNNSKTCKERPTKGKINEEESIGVYYDCKHICCNSKEWNEYSNDADERKKYKDDNEEMKKYKDDADVCKKCKNNAEERSKCTCNAKEQNKYKYEVEQKKCKDDADVCKKYKNNSEERSKYTCNAKQQNKYKNDVDEQKKCKDDADVCSKYRNNSKERGTYTCNAKELNKYKNDVDEQKKCKDDADVCSKYRNNSEERSKYTCNAKQQNKYKNDVDEQKKCKDDADVCSKYRNNSEERGTYTCNAKGLNKYKNDVDEQKKCKEDADVCKKYKNNSEERGTYTCNAKEQNKYKNDVNEQKKCKEYADVCKKYKNNSEEWSKYTCNAKEQNKYKNDVDEQKKCKEDADKRKKHQNDTEECNKYKNDADEKKTYKNDAEECNKYKNDAGESNKYKNDADEKKKYKNDAGESNKYKNDAEESNKYKNDAEECNKYKNDANEKKKYKNDADEKKKYKNDAEERKKYRTDFEERKKCKHDPGKEKKKCKNNEEKCNMNKNDTDERNKYNNDTKEQKEYKNDADQRHKCNDESRGQNKHKINAKEQSKCKNIAEEQNKSNAEERNMSNKINSKEDKSKEKQVETDPVPYIKDEVCVKANKKRSINFDVEERKEIKDNKYKRKEYKCKGEKDVLEKCDALCPDECECNNQGIIKALCDPLCPEDCSCAGEGIEIEKCDELCPDECICGGYGIREESNYLCSGDCCCQNDSAQSMQSEEFNSQRSGTSGPESIDALKTISKKDAVTENLSKTIPKNSAETKNASKTKLNKGSKTENAPKPKFRKNTQTENVSKTKSKKDAATECAPKCRPKKDAQTQKLSKTKSKKDAATEKAPKTKSKSAGTETVFKTKSKNDTELEDILKPKTKSKKKKDKHVSYHDIQRNCGVNIETFPSFNYLECSSAELTSEERFYCSCAIQCSHLGCDTDEEQTWLETDLEDSEECCSSATSSTTTIITGTSFDSCEWKPIRSDITDTNMTSEVSDMEIHRVCLEEPRRKRFHRKEVTLHNQCIGTEAEIRYTVGTITEERGPIRKTVVYLPKKSDTPFWGRRHKRDRGVSTKIVSFRSRVQVIPNSNNHDSNDIYTPSRYLLESQKYYNELFTTTTPLTDSDSV